MTKTLGDEELGKFEKFGVFNSCKWENIDIISSMTVKSLNLIINMNWIKRRKKYLTDN